MASREKLVAIAQRQRELSFVIVANVTVFALAAIVPDAGRLHALVGLASSALVLSAVVVVFLLVRQVSNLGVAVLCGLLMLLPLLNLLVMLVLSLSAIRVLRNAGIVVGMLGASREAVQKALPPG